MPSPSSAIPRVSIITPVWNRAALIQQTVASALAQTFKSFELIVADDGSTDDSAGRAAVSGDPRVSVLRLEHSGSPAVTRNSALRHARGRYVAFLDSDDQWLPDKLGEQVRMLDARRDAGMVYGLASYFDGERERGALGPKAARVPESLFELLLLQGNFIQPSTVLIRREICELLGGFDEADRFRAVEDYDLWLRVTKRYPALFIPRVITRYRRHDGNLSRDRVAMVAKVREVIEVTCQRSRVPEQLRDRALAHWYLEELKAVLVEGDAQSLETARAAVTKALEIDPSLRPARWAERLIKLGLFRPMQEAYRHRQELTGLRDTLHRFRWTRALR
jgi:hypothetical protein